MITLAKQSLGKLQNEVTKLHKQNLTLRDKNKNFSNENSRLRNRYAKLENEIDTRVEKACEATISNNNKVNESEIAKVKQEAKVEIIKTRTEYEKIIEDYKSENGDLKEEVARLKKLLNINESTSLPTGKTPINKNKRIPNSRKTTTKTKGGQFANVSNARYYADIRSYIETCDDRIKMVPLKREF